MKRSLGTLVIGVISTLTLTGCPGGGGKDASVAVANGQINSFANESCNVAGNNYQVGSYTCTQTYNGVILNTAVVPFATHQEFCAKINDNYSQTNRDPAQYQLVAQQTRSQMYINQSCQTVVQPNPTNPTNPSMEGLKSFTCQLQVRKGDAVFQGEAQQAYLYKSGGTLTLFANSVVNQKFWRYFYYPRIVNIGTVKMKYSPALGTNLMDQITMSVENVDGDITTSVSGFAGAENRIEITPQDADGDQTTLIASCSSSDAVTRPTLAAANLYQCAGTEKTKGKTNNFNYTNQLSDVIASGISITRSVFVQGEDAGSVTFTQASNSFGDSTISLKSYLGASTSVSISKTGYSLKAKCLAK